MRRKWEPAHAISYLKSRSRKVKHDASRTRWIACLERTNEQTSGRMFGSPCPDSVPPWNLGSLQNCAPDSRFQDPNPLLLGWARTGVNRCRRRTAPASGLRQCGRLIPGGAIDPSTLGANHVARAWGRPHLRLLESQKEGSGNLELRTTGDIDLLVLRRNDCSS
jgi:hypothetical protein